MREKYGFTLLELLGVILLGSILLLVVITRVKSYFTPRLYNAARRLVSDIQWTQNLAEIIQDNHRIIFYPSLDKYCVYRGTTTIVNDPLSHKPMVRDFTISKEFKNVDIELAEFPVGTEYLEFNPLGVPSSGGRVTLSYDNELYEINVENNTGAVTLQKIN